MGVTNFDNLPQNIAQTRLIEARQIANERKGSAQRVAGSNLRYFRTNNSGTYAWTGLLDKPSAAASSTGITYFTITLTSATAPTFLSDLVLEPFTSPDGVTWTAYVPTTGPFGYQGYLLRAEDAASVTPYESKYFVSMSGTLNDHRAFKLQALSTDEVAISVVRTV
jgi:hypothetical protein